MEKNSTVRLSADHLKAIYKIITTRGTVKPISQLPRRIKPLFLVDIRVG